MKKHLITLPKFIMAMLAVLGLVLLPITAASAVVTESSVTIVPDAGAPDSGSFVLNVAANDTVIVDLYAVAPVTGVKTRINLRPVTYDGPIDELVLGNTFSGLSAGTTVFGCIIKDNVADCDEYVVPGAPAPVDTDEDGVADDGTDKCLGTPSGTVVDASGCAVVIVRPDVDVDGVPDDGPDKCLGTLPGVVVDVSGCPIVAPPIDSDVDGVPDDGTDKCLGTPSGTVVDASGCAVIIPPVDSETRVEAVKVDSLSKSCPAGQDIVGAHFVITQIGDASPGEISVVLSNGETISVARTARTGPTAHYSTSLSGDVTVTNAFADVPVDWSGEFNLSHYNCGEKPVPPVTCPLGTEWMDTDQDGVVDEGECVNPTHTVTCDEGTTWIDTNGNGKIDAGECKKPAPPVIVPPVIVPPVVVPPVVVPVVSTPVDSDVDETNGRGATIETAATEANASAQAGGLVGLAILMAVTATVAIGRRRAGTK